MWRERYPLSVSLDLLMFPKEVLVTPHHGRATTLLSFQCHNLGVGLEISSLQ